MAIVIDVKVKMSGVAGKLAQLDQQVGRVNSGLARMNALLQNATNNAIALSNALSAAGGGPAGRIATRTANGGGGLLRQSKGLAAPSFATSAVGPKTYGKSKLGGSLPPKSSIPQTFNPASGKKPPDPFLNNPAAGAAYYQQAAAMGNASAIRQFMRYSGQSGRLQRGQQLAQGGGSSFGQAAMSLLMRSRYGAGKGIMPLGMDIVKLLGSLNPELRLVTEAVGILATVTKHAYQALDEFASGLVRGGGSLNQVSAAQSIGNFTGVDVAGVGKNLSGYAAARFGLFPVAGPFGDMNYSRRGAVAAGRIANASSFDKARRLAELAGAPELAKLNLLDKGDKRRVMAGAGGTSMEDLSNLTKFQANASMLSQRVSLIATKIGGPILGAIGSLMGVIDRMLGAWDLNKLSAFISSMFDGVRMIFDAINKFFDWLNEHIPDTIKNLMGLKTGHGSAVDRNTKALEDNTKALNQGIAGGGDRARSGPSRLDPNDKYNPGYNRVPYGIL